MEEKSKKRRDWIKNITIIFLVVMLLLTFFSNTIMNYSLPEVSAQYTSSGNVLSRVRGTASVEAVQPYDIKIEEKRKVEEVKIKTGDTIKKGQVLFILGDSDGTALDEAQDALDTAVYEYDSKRLKDPESTGSGALDIQFAKEDYNNAVEDLREAKEKSDKYDSDKRKLESGIKSVEKKIAGYAQDVRDVEKQKTSTTRLKTKTEKELEQVTALTSTIIGKYKLEENTKYVKEWEAVLKENDNVEQLKALDDLNFGAYDLAIRSAEKLLKKAQNVLIGYLNADIDKLTETIDSYALKVEEIKANSDTKTKELEEKKAKLAALEKVDVTAAEKAVDTTKRAYKKLVDEVDKKEDTSSNAEELVNLELNNMQKKIARLREKVDRLKESTATNEVVSKVAGIVSTVGYVAGDITTLETPLAVIELTDRGYAAKLSVTTEQSKLVREGSVAEILNVWGAEITATLSSIKDDTNNPGKNKILTFDIVGDVTLGQSLELAVGEKGGFYDVVVPNSAIHEDSKGKFLLTVQVKSSPLGNRYVATRLDIEVIVADETSSAISGSATGGEFVISTSTKPIEPGMQVRLVEGGDV